MSPPASFACFSACCLFVLGTACAKESRCGDGVVDVGELCDDGNAVDGDGCRSDCAGLEVCGDGLVDRCEQCDDGGETASCDADCTLVVCGDGTLNRSAGERCAADTSDDVGCLVDCPCPDCCGNGRVDPGEECDDGADTMACDADCTFAVCGDGHDNPAAGEQCDWGDADDVCGAIVREGTHGNRDDEPDACRADCRRPVCGDGVTDPGQFPDGDAIGEECDDGGRDTAACDADCTNPVCGDGYVNAAAGEVCDADGVDTADCDADCTAPACGDHHLNRAAGEQCETHADCPPSYYCAINDRRDSCLCVL